MNEQEALPLWKLFEDATGVKVNYVRSSDTQIMAKVAIENRAGQHTWDIAFTTTVPQLPHAYLAPFDPPEAKGLMAEARDRQSPLVWRLRQLQCAGLQHQIRQQGGPAEKLRRFRRAQGMGRQDRDRRYRRRMARRDFRLLRRRARPGAGQEHRRQRSTRSSPTAISRLRVRSGPANIGWRSTTFYR